MSIDIVDGLLVLHDSDEDVLNIVNASRFGGQPAGTLVITAYDNESGEVAAVRVSPEEWRLIVAAFPPAPPAPPALPAVEYCTGRAAGDRACRLARHGFEEHEFVMLSQLPTDHPRYAPITGSWRPNPTTEGA